jgi:predicted metal-binding membrane protein
VRSALAGLPRRDRVLIPVCIAIVTALSWAYLIRLDPEMCVPMGDSRMPPALAVNWIAADAWFNFAMWAVMMAAMMAPAAAPVVMLFAAARAGQGGRFATAAALVFGLGYLAVWTLFSAGATAAQWGLHQKALLSVMMSTTSPRLAGAILIAAGVYQLTRWKSRCLTHCRSPLGFLMSNWRDGAFGAFQMGFRHGVYCLGCCWALMGVLFAVGVMNLVWVGAITAFVLVEKIGPAGEAVAHLAGVALIVFGLSAFI